MAGADYFDPSLFERVVNVLGLAAAGTARGVQGVVVMAQAQGDAVGGTPELGHLRLAGNARVGSGKRARFPTKPEGPG